MEVRNTEITKKLEVAHLPVTVQYFWDAHGELHKWTNDDNEHKVTQRAENARIDCVKYDLVDDEFGTCLSREHWKLTIDGKPVQGLVYGYTHNKTNLQVDVVIGWG